MPLGERSRHCQLVRWVLGDFLRPSDQRSIMRRSFLAVDDQRFDVAFDGFRGVLSRLAQIDRLALPVEGVGELQLAVTLAVSRK